MVKTIALELLSIYMGNVHNNEKVHNNEFGLPKLTIEQSLIIKNEKLQNNIYSMVQDIVFLICAL